MKTTANIHNAHFAVLFGQAIVSSPSFSILHQIKQFIQMRFKVEQNLTALRHKALNYTRLIPLTIICISSLSSFLLQFIFVIILPYTLPFFIVVVN